MKLLDVCQGPRLPSEQSIILIFEFIDYDLDSYVKSHAANINHNKIVDLMSQMLHGVDFLHMNRIIHVNIFSNLSLIC